MKKVLFWVLLFAPSILFSQSETEKKPAKSKLETFSEETGTLIETTIEEIGKLGYSCSIKVHKLKNLITGAKTSGVSFELDNQRSFIDAEEMDGLIQSLAIMKDAANTTKPVYTEIKFKTRIGFEVGAYFDIDKKETKNTGVKKWMYYFIIPQRSYRNALDPADFMAFCGYIDAAKSKL